MDGRKEGRNVEFFWGFFDEIIAHSEVEWYSSTLVVGALLLDMLAGSLIGACAATPWPND